jgi:ribose 5-phosphate isomerase B
MPHTVSDSTIRSPTKITAYKRMAPAVKALRIVVGGDDAGFEMKAKLIADLKKDPRVLSVEDVGPFKDTDKTAYPHFAVAAARKVSSSP